MSKTQIELALEAGLEESKKKGGMNAYLNKYFKVLQDLAEANSFILSGKKFKATNMPPEQIALKKKIAGLGFRVGLANKTIRLASTEDLDTIAKNQLIIDEVTPLLEQAKLELEKYGVVEKPAYVKISDEELAFKREIGRLKWRVEDNQKKLAELERQGRLEPHNAKLKTKSHEIREKISNLISELTTKQDEYKLKQQ